MCGNLIESILQLELEFKVPLFSPSYKLQILVPLLLHVMPRLQAIRIEIIKLDKLDYFCNLKQQCPELNRIEYWNKMDGELPHWRFENI